MSRFRSWFETQLTSRDDCVRCINGDFVRMLTMIPKSEDGIL